MSGPVYAPLLSAVGATFVREPLRRGVGTVLYGSGGSVLLRYRPDALMLYTVDAADARRARDGVAACAHFAPARRLCGLCALRRTALARLILSHSLHRLFSMLCTVRTTNTTDTLM